MPPRLEPVDYDPFEGARGFFPAFDAAAPAAATEVLQPLFDDRPASPGVKAINKLFGTGGETRHQLWPEAMVRRVATLTERAASGDNPFESITGMPGAASPGAQDATYEPNLLGKALGVTAPWQAPGHESGIAMAQDMAGLMAGGPLLQRPGTATLGSGALRPGEAALPKTEAVPPFYSATEAAIRDASQASMSPEQWRGYLSNRPGVKAEELDWVGMPEGKKVTKQQMLDHLDEHGVKVKEVHKDMKSLDDDLIGDAVEGHLNSWGDDYVLQHGREPTPQEFQTARAEITEDIRNSPADYGVETEGNAKFSEYQLPGGENYREKLFTLPDRSVTEKIPYKDAMPGMPAYYEKVKVGDNFNSSHWDEPNVLAHVRMNDRLIPRNEAPAVLSDADALAKAKQWVNEGGENWDKISKVRQDAWVEQMKKVEGRRAEEAANTPLKTLHLEELQSDWHQAGRKEGYKPSKEALDKATEEYVTAAEQMDHKSPEFLELQRKFKDINERAHSSAPDAPFKTTWPDLVLKRMIREASENGYDAISWTPGEAQAARYDLSKQIDRLELTHNRDGGGELIMHPKNGRAQNIPIKSKAHLADTVGKDLAEKLYDQGFKNNGRANLEGLDLKVGGEGMKGFYDKILVDKANALAKKFGGKVEFRDDVVYPTLSNKIGEAPKVTKIPVLRLTPQMRDTALRKGFPLFSSGVPFPLIPVDHDPFAEDK